MLDEQQLAEIEERLQPLLEAEQRARELSSVVPRAKLYVGVCGASLAFDRFEILNGFAIIRSVTNPPGLVHVASAADLKETDYLGVSRFSHMIQAELAVGNADISGHNKVDFLLGIAWHTAALIKLRNHITLYCPASASASWDTVSMISDHSVSFGMLDDVSKQIHFQEPAVVSIQDMEWVKSNWEAALGLRNKDTSRRFGLAFNLAYTWNQTNG